MDSGQELTQIDVAGTLRQRAPRYSRALPRFAVRWLERLIHQDELNQILRHMAAQPNAVKAAEAALRDLRVAVRLDPSQPLPAAAGRYLFVSNHPLGGLDGLALIACLGRHYGGHIRFLVNDLLMAVTPLRPVFLPVNKYGRQGREGAAQIEAQFRGPNQMITFPAGLCSRLDDEGRVRDLVWHKMAVTHAVSSQRDVVPLFFEGRNSRRFYRVARLRKRLGVKFNFEMVMLPGEMFKCGGATFTIHVGQPVPWQSLDAAHPAREASRLREMVYQLAPEARAPIV